MGRQVIILLLLVLTCSAQFNYRDPAFLANAAAIPSSALSPVPDILWWKFTDGSGTTITADVGPNGTTDADWVTGKSGSGYALEGNGSSQEAQSVSAVAYDTNILTVAFWLNSDDVTAFSIVAENFNGGGSFPDTWFFFVTSDTLAAGSSGTSGYRQESVGITSGTWIHVLAVFNNSTGSGDIAIYLDGVSQSTALDINSKTGTANFSAQTVNLLGRTASALWHDGKIDDFRIHTGDRSADTSAIMDDAQ